MYNVFFSYSGHTYNKQKWNVFNSILPNISLTPNGVKTAKKMLDQRLKICVRSTRRFIVAILMTNKSETFFLHLQGDVLLAVFEGWTNLKIAKKNISNLILKKIKVKIGEVFLDLGNKQNQSVPNPWS